MSYILDALKRADAQRTHGGVPGLHTRQLATPALPAATRTGRYLWPAVAALALGTSAALWWLWPMPGRELQLAAVPSAATKAPVNTGQVQPPAMVTTKSAVAATPATSAMQSAKPATTTEIAARQTVAPLPSKPESELSAKTLATSARATIKPPTPIPGTPASVSQTESAALPLLSELPQELRRQIPALVITGAVYSANPAQRLLLVNNQVLTQGSLAAPELTLEEIRAKSSVFSFRGTRFRLAH
jgi:general secretion pathway protein B